MSPQSAVADREEPNQSREQGERSQQAEPRRDRSERRDDQDRVQEIGRRSLPSGGAGRFDQLAHVDGQTRRHTRDREHQGAHHGDGSDGDQEQPTRSWLVPLERSPQRPPQHGQGEDDADAVAQGERHPGRGQPQRPTRAVERRQDLGPPPPRGSQQKRAGLGVAGERLEHAVEREGQRQPDPCPGRRAEPGAHAPHAHQGQQSEREVDPTDRPADAEARTVQCDRSEEVDEHVQGAGVQSRGPRPQGLEHDAIAERQHRPDPHLRVAEQMDAFGKPERQDRAEPDRQGRPRARGLHSSRGRDPGYGSHQQQPRLPRGRQRAEPVHAPEEVRGRRRHQQQRREQAERGHAPTA